jgi:2'-5' RNA ligase
MGADGASRRQVIEPMASERSDDQRSANARMFFGLPVDAALAARLAPLACTTAEAAGGRPVPPANLHATLAFIGTVPRAQVARLETIGDAMNGSALELTLDRVGSFRGARVAWIGASQVPATLTRLQSTLAEALRDAGYRTDERPYHPHVTLARHCRHAFAITAVAPLPWRVDTMTLYESMTLPAGPRYVARATWTLGSDARA